MFNKIFIIIIWCVLGVLAASARAIGLPVVPGAGGFGMNTEAGRGGKIYRVSNLADSGTGSLRECVEAVGHRVCVFEVAGAIWLKSKLRILNSNITIAGQTAPSPGIELRNNTLGIFASDVLVQHIRIRVGDDPSGPPYENRDAIQIEGRNAVTTSNVVIDHVTASWAVDETITLYFDWDNVTIRNSIISECLYDSFHPMSGEPGNGKGIGKALLFNDSSGLGRVTLAGNIIAHCADRNPRTLTSDVVMVNNVIYNAKEAHADLSTNGTVSRNTLVGNVFIDGPDSKRYRKSIWLDGVVAGSQVYLSNNFSPDLFGSDQWTMVDNYSGQQRESIEISSPPVWPHGLSFLPNTRDIVLNTVLSNAGARPNDRDLIDKRIIANVRNGDGIIVNCVSPDGSVRCSRNAGGWQSLSQTYRQLNLPDNPSADDDGDGYTNLEEWLHKLAAAVEGKVAQPNAPVVDVK